MDISNLANTFLFLNLRSENIDYVNICIILAIIYVIKYYNDIYHNFQVLYNKHLFKKCSINLEMKLTNNIQKSYKVLGILYRINSLSLSINEYEEIYSEFELINSDDSFNDINSSHLIPKISNLKIQDDLYITIEINTKNIKNNNHDDEKKNNSVDIDIINISICCYNNNIEYIKKFVEVCELEYLKFLNRYNDKNFIFTSQNISGNDDFGNKLRFSRYVLSSNKNFHNLFFDGKDEIIKRINSYTNDKEKYKKLGIPHTLGFLFHGLPGTGKTSTIKAIANYTNRSVISINMNHVSSVEDLIKIFNTDYINQYNIKLQNRIYVFEEIDCYDCFISRDIVKEKENKTELIKPDLSDVLYSSIKTNKKEKEKEKLTIGQVLEVLDGIIECEDRLCIFTTNHIEKIDNAFLRPGRIDVILEFKKLRKVDIQNLFKLWFNTSIPEKDLRYIKDYSITQAEFGKLCFENSPNKVITRLITQK